MGDHLKLLMDACVTARLAAQRRAPDSDYWATVSAILGDEGFHREIAAEALASGDPRQAVSTVIARFSRRAQRRLTGPASEVWFELKGAERLLIALIEEQAALEAR